MNVGFHDGSPERATFENGRVGYSEAAVAATPGFYPQNLWISMWKKFE
jgi:hypothetical protein